MTTDILINPCVAFGREICGDLEAGLTREWLVTNGIGGYASGTVAGPLTRSYHGLLVAALDPPVERTVLVAGTVEWVTYDGIRYPISAHDFNDFEITPDGYRNLESFRLEGTLPVWEFAIADALLERRLWMTYGENTTWITWRLLRGSLPVEIEITPLVTYRAFHGLASGEGWSIGVDPIDDGVTINAWDGAVPFYLRSDHATFASNPTWWWNFCHRAETERGLGDHGDLFAPGTFRAALSGGETVTCVFSLASDGTLDAATSLATEQARQQALIEKASASKSDPVVQQLVLAADQFLVARPLPDVPEGRSVIAGYHWFNDWGRDTMIALPGLAFATGRPEEANAILRTFARHVDQGLLPNNFPDHAGVVPGYNTADATLWFVLAIRSYEEATGDKTLATDLRPVLRDIVEHHIAGTRYGIGVDPADGLLHVGEPGVQLTWMDAKVGDWVVTPRIGKPVEINALWYNALRAIEAMLTERADTYTASLARERADQVRSSFRMRFVHPEHGYLADVIDGPDGDDWSLRPNQIFAISLPEPLLEADEAQTVFTAVSRSLQTSFGLRSLVPADPAYIGTYGGDQLSRDGSYHQGPVWGWLLGPYVEAHYRLFGDRDASRALLRPIGDHLSDAGLGSISEIFEGDPPHAPRGCVAQAWSVAETLRILRLLEP